MGVGSAFQRRTYTVAARAYLVPIPQHRRGVARPPAASRDIGADGLFMHIGTLAFIGLREAVPDGGMCRRVPGNSCRVSTTHSRQLGLG